MKNYYYLILLLIFSSEIFSQETEFKFNNQTGMTDFIVTKVENKTASELFKKTMLLNGLSKVMTFQIGPLNLK